MMAYIYGKIKQIRLPFFRSSSKFAKQKTQRNRWLLGMIADDLIPGSLGLPRWRTCQIPDPGAAISVKIPTHDQGKALKLLRVARPPPPRGWPHQGHCRLVFPCSLTWRDIRINVTQVSLWSRLLPASEVQRGNGKGKEKFLHLSLAVSPDFHLWRSCSNKQLQKWLMSHLFSCCKVHLFLFV